ncbi:XdhC family protein [Anaerocolumna sp. AGMB13025]|uniref:XdhC family protein n=1 Tax=Anaerocolumna sp. AGMB13025 TaxID=3039116 RepID=UPI00241CD10F|nr:XdhC/CoxI family protein [Anaerocolumna sp. AGMB13025]WFR57942.1 XdhC family protein [Anaerocolumna sp. AGMB13025]
MPERNRELMNFYGKLLKALDNNENKLVITTLGKTAGTLNSDFDRNVLNTADMFTDRNTKSSLTNHESPGNGITYINRITDNGVDNNRVDNNRVDNNRIDNNVITDNRKKDIELIDTTLTDMDFINSAKEVLKSGKPKVMKEGEKTIFMEPFYPRERLIILGGGHIALPLAEFSAKTGYSVTVVDDRPSFANKARFPYAENVICESFGKALEQLKLTAYDYLVVITRGHRHDTECLRYILRQPETIYLGMIGSRRRVGVVLDMLKEEGFDKERINRICTPIGLSIGAVTPEEISISILAQLISRKRLDRNETFTVNRSDLDLKVLELLASEEDIPKSIVTVIDTKGSTPRGVGAKMIVYETGQIAGSIGGGCSEAQVIHNAVGIIGSKSFLLQTIDMTGETAESEGMVCGGIMEVLIEDCI